jgi:hypothetical protein
MLKEILQLSLAFEPETRTGSFDLLLLFFSSEGGLGIGEQSNDSDLFSLENFILDQALLSSLMTNEVSTSLELPKTGLAPISSSMIAQRFLSAKHP